MPIDETRPEPNILLVEDNPVDVLMIRRALRNSGFTKQPIVLDDGEPALVFLGERRNLPGGALPDLVILDLNLRRVDGPEVLSYIRATPELRDLRVILLSSMPEDLMKAKTPEADCYIEKPCDVASFLNLGERIRTFYFDAQKAAGA